MYIKRIIMHFVIGIWEKGFSVGNESDMKMINLYAYFWKRAERICWGFEILMQLMKKDYSVIGF